MEPQHVELIGIALFLASELIGMSPLRSNSVLQLTLQLLQQAFPSRRP